ncbi:biotin holocarboxylase synthetase [Tilletia horrida]|uniref:Biotin holocarboxylase synthetase n=1 Tax=Tilletia horrida TaxID=155126 RepID=A0AAN6JLF3_9BASI|nr:biotin holocarboxylase synthetase [Tilletia horrida]
MTTNILVYDGPGVSASALQHTLRSLRRLLPAYDVQTADARTLALEPWQTSTALVVLPGGRDLPYVSALSQTHAHAHPSLAATTFHRRADDQIARYVHAGGRFLGICAGAYYASARCVFEPGTPMHVVGDRPALRFFPGDCVGTVYPGFVYESDAGARLIDLELSAEGREQDGGEVSFQCQYNGGGAFVQADSFKGHGVTVLARYSHTDPVLTSAAAAAAASSSSQSSQKPNFAGQAAAVICQVDAGKALLYGSHPEFPMSTMAKNFDSAKYERSVLSAAHLRDPAAVKDTTVISALERAESRRLAVFGSHLALLGLNVDLPEQRSTLSPAQTATVSSQPTQDNSKTTAPSITDPPRLTPLLLASTDSDAFWDRIRRSSAAVQPGAKATSKHLATISDLMPSGKIAAPAFTIADGNDTFHVLSGQEALASAPSLWQAALDADYDAYTPETAPAPEGGSAIEADPDLHAVPKYIVALPDAHALADDASSLEQVRSLAPYFDLYAYLAALQRARERISAIVRQGKISSDSMLAGIDAGPARWGTGDVQLGNDVMYGQVVTSTQTMLDKNFKLLRALPTGFTSIATHQVSGRGRGKNAWISPLGCFQFSLVLRLPASAASRIVFIQYLAGLAVVLALRDGVGLPSTGQEKEDERIRGVFRERVGKKVRIKWPNDLYAEVGDAGDVEGAGEAASELGGRKGTFVQGGKRYAKLGGILVNSQFADKEFLLVVGCGVNVLNRRPTTSVSDLILAANATAAERGEPLLPILSQEQFGGGVLATFERLWGVFEQAGGWTPFVEAYKDVWLHSDQMAHLADADPPTPVRIVGISSDYGFLRAVHASSSLTTASAGAWGPAGAGAGMGAGASWIDLQPDGNSFDMLHNLIRRKD